MRRRTLPMAMALLIAAAACGPADIVVTVAIDVDNPDGEGTVTRPLDQLEVQLLPYDRDAVFDSMTAAFGEPEPEIPQDLLNAREEVRRAQERWRAAESRWNTLRDTLQKINETMKQFSRGEARYVALYREFQELDGELSTVERRMNAAFEEFDRLQKGTIQQSDSIRILQDNWADEAFAGVGDIFRAKARAAGMQPVVDTTDANGIVHFQGKPGKTYWVHTRYPLTFSELYWNVRVTVESRDPIELRLDRSNAEERIKL